MRVYELGADVERYRQIDFATDRLFIRWYQRFDGTPLKRYWTGKERFKFEPLGDRPKGDIMSLTACPVFTLKAIKALADVLEPNGELIQIRCQKDTLFLYNVTRLIDALDEENCVVDRFDNRVIWNIDRYSFVENNLTGAVVFKLPQYRLGHVYVTDPFLQRVMEHGLKGFRFRLVWSTEEGFDPDPAAAVIVTT